MQVFELHFNPKAKEDVICDSFCYEPENIYGKRLGNLYMVGKLTNVLPQNLNFLEKLAKLLKKGYYAKLKPRPEESLRETLKKANEFLATIAKQGNVSWLGNLNFGVFTIKDFTLNFSKTGNIKVFLLRGQNLMDIGADLEFQDMEPYPLKVFGSIATGKLALNDKILVFTKEVFDFFKEKKLMGQMPRVVDEASLKEVLRSNQKLLSEISGICLLAIIKEKVQPKQFLAFQKIKVDKISSLIQFFKKIPSPLRIFWVLKEFPKVLAQKKRKILKIKEIRLPKIRTWLRQNLVFSLRSKIRTWLRQNLVFSLRSKIAFPKIPRLRFPEIRFKISFSRKALFSLLFLILILILGFLVFRKEREAEFKKSQQLLEKVQAKTTLAQNFLIFKDEEKANLLLQEAYKDLLPLVEVDNPLRREALDLKKSIEESLILLNKLIKIKDPNVLFELDPKEIKLNPQKMVVLISKLYLFNPNFANFYQLKIEEKTGSLLSAPRNLTLGISFSDSVLFFAKPNILIRYFPQGEFQEIFLSLPEIDSEFSELASFRSNIYFLDKKSGQIIKYGPAFGQPASWLNPKTKKAIGVKSMSVDGSIWILNKDNEIDRYYGGIFKETLKLNLFPFLENPTKIWTSQFHPYLYILEPKKNRIIILTKHGEIVKQYQSEKFDNLLDFAVSEDSKTIWLLSGLKIYQIQI